MGKVIEYHTLNALYEGIKKLPKEDALTKVAAIIDSAEHTPPKP